MSTVITYDLCIIGAGPAGIINALEYSKQNPTKTICLVEYGLPKQGEKNDLDDSIKITNPVNHHPPYECTNKGLGGSSQSWGGRCVMYDEVDFIDRPVVNNGCTWKPELFEEVKKYTKEACDYFECGEPIFDLANHPEFKSTKIAPGFKSDIVTDSVIERWSKPTNFGKRYSEELHSRDNISLMQGFEAKKLVKDETGTVQEVVLKHITNEDSETVLALSFIIAAGTQETTRFLLRNKHLFDNLGFVPDSLGKYYQGHISGKIASIKFYGDPRQTDYYFFKDADGIYLRRRFQFTSKFLAENNLLNTALWLDNPLYHDYKHRSGAMSFMYLVMITPFISTKLAPPALITSITKGKKENIAQHLWNIVKDFPRSIIAPAKIFYKRYLKDRKLPGIFLYSPKNTYALHFHAEQVPHEQNQIHLDENGKNLIIDYYLTDDDINSVIKQHELLDRELRSSGCGELQYWYPKDQLAEMIRKNSSDGIHQSGATRIASNAKDGVVDENLKVWGTNNLYICSSSVFPTSGQANPTFLLGAFAVRLAKHLSQK